VKFFWLRLSGFCFLWVYMILQYSKNDSFSILFFALALAVYFFLSIKHVSVYLYSSLSIIVFMHGLLMTDYYIMTVFLILYITIVAAFWMKGRRLIFFMCLNFFLAMILVFLNGSYWIEYIIMLLFFFNLIVILNRMALERREQKEIYDQLLGEYRKLKRMNLVAEKEARMEERTKIARDIHDSVGHKLTALIMKLEMQALNHNIPAYKELKAMAEESLQETRGAVRALQVEENEGIASVVHLIRKLESQSQMLVQFTMKQGVLSVPLSNDKNVILYRVIQEALTNTMRHSGSREVHIILGKGADGAVSFEIRNKTSGRKPFTFGFGLQNMKKRVEEINGNINIYQTEMEFVVSGSIPND